MKKGVVIALLVIVVVSLVVTLLVRAREERIAVIPLSGTIAGTSQVGLLITSEITPKLVRDYLKRAEEDISVKAVVLRIDSSGGSAAASQEIAAMVRSFKKPVVISMGDVATSGAYYISVYADKIVANPSSATGSIGVIMEVIYIEGLLEKLGLEIETITSPPGEHKDMGLRKLTDEERQILQDMCDEIYYEFLIAVAEGRNLSIEEVAELATGQPYTGQQALSLGLVAELGGLEEAIALAAELAGVEKPEVEWYVPQAQWWEQLMRFLTKVDRFLELSLSEDYILFLRMLEGWQAVPRY